MRPGDERIFAYVDGELDPAGTALVEAAIAADPAVAEAVAQARRLRAQLRDAFDPMLDEPVPAHLLALARGAGSTATAAAAATVPAPVTAPGGGATVHPLPRPARRRWALPEWTAMAAALVLGIAVSRLVMAPPAGPLASESGRLVADGVLAESLQSRLGAETGDGLRIGLSFRDRDGAFCRAFRVGGERDLAGLACRAPDGRWQVPVVVSVPPVGGEGLRQASTALPEIVLAELDARIDGEPLDAAQEREARDAGWR
ncbi:hypothetical protein [Arenimonas metalli]|uniref:Anti-sigma factor n=1 Tax=Arenimonas metalli CF5-1 TaxID=1384056 RepID=A0A091BUQ6_9GAMM|nr:hypothetical protein [Arenimonas metalli]KFN48075.1 hypothetical protein N787_06455 [Arenimonas metalli CF5-1]